MLRTAHPGSSDLGHEFDFLCRRKKNRERFMQGFSRRSLINLTTIHRFKQ
jgi:hypothetical protein